MATPISNTLSTAPFSFSAQNLNMPNNMSATTPSTLGLTTPKASTTSSALFSAPAATTAPATGGSLTPSGTGGSIGSYKGQPIYAGSDADVSAQIAKIDQQNSPANVTPAVGGTTTPGLVTPPAAAGATTPAAAASPVSGLFSSTAASLANPQPSAATTAAETAYSGDIARLQAYEAQSGQALQGIYSPTVTTSGAIMQGRAAAEQEAANTTIGNLQAAATQQQGLITLGQNQQQLNQTAEQAALTATQPQQSYPFVFNPQTGTYTNAAGGGVLSPTQIAENINNGTMSPDQGTAAGSYLGGTAQSQIAAAMQNINPNYNWNTGAGAAAGAATGASAVAAAGGTGTAGVLTSIPAMQAANTAAVGIQNQINSFLQANPTLNQSNSTLANAAQQWVQGKQLGDAQYQQLFNYLTEYANTLAPVLGVGGDPTNFKTEIANSLVNAQASGQSISTVLQGLAGLATTKISNLQSGATGGSVTNPATTPAGTGGGWGSLSYGT